MRNVAEVESLRCYNFKMKQHYPKLETHVASDNDCSVSSSNVTVGRSPSLKVMHCNIAPHDNGPENRV